MSRLAPFVGHRTFLAIVALGAAAILAAPASATTFPPYSAAGSISPVGSSTTGRGVMKATVFNTSASDSRITLRGSVRLSAGRWCLRSRLLPDEGGPSKTATVALSRTQTIAVPRFTRTLMKRYVASDFPRNLARVTVHSGGCSGRVIARGVAYQEVFE